MVSLLMLFDTSAAGPVRLLAPTKVCIQSCFLKAFFLGAWVQHGLCLLLGVHSPVPGILP